MIEQTRGPRQGSFFVQFDLLLPDCCSSLSLASNPATEYSESCCFIQELALGKAA